MRRAGFLALLATALLLCAPARAQDEEALTAAPDEPVKQIRMYAENWKWTPKTIRVTKGTRLSIDFESRDASHSFDLKSYKIKVPLPEGSKKHFEFVADKVGEFRFKCGRPCGNGCAKMTGTLIVEE